MSNNLNKRIEAVEQAIGHIGNAADEEAIEGYCKAHNIAYQLNKPIVIYSWPDLHNDGVEWLTSAEEAHQHSAALEALGCKRVMHIEFVYPD